MLCGIVCSSGGKKHPSSNALYRRFVIFLTGTCGGYVVVSTVALEATRFSVLICKLATEKGGGGALWVNIREQIRSTTATFHLGEERNVCVRYHRIYPFSAATHFWMLTRVIAAPSRCIRSLLFLGTRKTVLFLL